jgi:hypothetical protein
LRERLTVVVPVQLFGRLHRWQRELDASVIPGIFDSATDPHLQHVPIHPRGELVVNVLPRERSFHIGLQRFAAYFVKEVAKNPDLAPVLTELLDNLKENDQLVRSMVEVGPLSLGHSDAVDSPLTRWWRPPQIPLSVLVMTSEIRVGMWKRNGHVMDDQVVNYAEPPFCKMFRDMDLLLLQFGGQNPAECLRASLE